MKAHHRSIILAMLALTSLGVAPGFETHAWSVGKARPKASIQTPATRESAEALPSYLARPEVKAHLDQLTRSRETFNQIKLLHLGNNSNPVRQQLASEAQDFIYLDVPYWFSDEEGMKFYKILKSKREANPNLDLRILLDWSTPASSDDFWHKGMCRKLDKISGGQLEYWNSPKWSQSWSAKLLKNHMHDKLFIVDGKKLILGGLNIENTYLQGGLTREGWHDTDILIEGPAAVDATKIFLKTHELAKYFSEGSMKSPAPASKRETSGLLQNLYYADRLELPFRIMDDQYSINLPLAERFAELDRLFPEATKPTAQASTSVRLIYDNPLVDRDRDTGKHFSKTRDTLAFLFANARERVRIFMPYLTLTTEYKKILVETAKRVPVEIITNSRISHDLGKYPYYAAMSHYRELMAAGIKVYEWQGHKPLMALEKQNNCQIPVGEWPGNTMHTKVVMIDGEVSLVGSHNMNTRSEGYNSEIMALVIDREITQQLEEVFTIDRDDADPAPTVSCGDQKLPRPRRVQQVTREQVDQFHKRYGHQIDFFRRLQFAM